MRLAFYAPLKAPDHPTPSGDRTMARNLIAALQGTGAQVDLASDFRSRDGAGNADVQTALMAEAATRVPTIVANGRAAGWRAWITYHNYYKAPDLLGPAVAKALEIPYLQVESTRARKRLAGPWAAFAQRAEAASDAAATILYFTSRDAEALHRDAPNGQQLIHLRPFLNRADLPPQSTGTGPLLAVGMMREGDKLASYQIIAETLALLPEGTWALHIAGDGPARAQVEKLMKPFGDAVTSLGELDADTLAKTYQYASVLFWPGVNEAFGLAYLEAQAAGLSVVAQDRPGVRDVLAPGAYPKPQAGVEALATRLIQLLSNATHRQTAGDTARAQVGAHHLLPAATATLRQALNNVGVPL